MAWDVILALRRWKPKFHRRFQFIGCFLRTALYFCHFRWLPIEGTFFTGLSFVLFRWLLLEEAKFFFNFFKKFLGQIQKK